MEPLPLGILVRIAEKEIVLGGVSDFFDRVNDLREERVFGVRDDEPDRSGFLAPERPRATVDAVIEGECGAHDAVPRFARDRFAIVENARNAGDRKTGPLRDVSYARHGIRRLFSMHRSGPGK